MYPTSNSCKNHILRPSNVGGDAFGWIVFGNGDNLQSGCMNHTINPMHSQFKPLAITDIANKKPKTRIGKLTSHFFLGMFTSAVNHNPFDFCPQQMFSEGLAEGASAAGDQDFCHGDSTSRTGRHSSEPRLDSHNCISSGSKDAAANIGTFHLRCMVGFQTSTSSSIRISSTGQRHRLLGR